MSLSVIIITCNESRHIGACLDSVAFADEIIVVDSGSTDNTRDIALARGAMVEQTCDWPGFGPQKNRALDRATKEWVLSIDADERVTPELAIEIRKTLQQPAADAYRIPRLSNFLGRWIYHGGWWPDPVLRLFRRGTARFNDAAVHESVQASGATLMLRAHFLHYPYDNLEGLVTKMNRYSSDAAAMMHERGKRSGLSVTLGHAAWTFIRIYFVRRGFLDGKEGFVLAATAATGTFFRYAKLMFLAGKDK